MKSRSPSGTNSASSNGQQRQSSPADTSRTESMDTADKQMTRSDRHHILISKLEKGEGRYLTTPLTDDDEELMADPRARTSSMDTHHRQVNQNALLKLLQKFKNPSASFPSLDHSGKHGGKSSKQSSARSGSPLTKSRSAESSMGSNNCLQQQQPPRRRFVRVVRDADAPPPEQVDDNPHTRVSYTQEFLAKHYSQKPQDDDVKPYTTTGHTILKKSSGSGGELAIDPLSPAEHESGSPSVSSKRATFFGEVEVIEYSLQDKVAKSHEKHTTPIRFDDDSSVDGVNINAEESLLSVSSSNADVAEGSSVDRHEKDVVAGATVTFSNPSPTEDIPRPVFNGVEPMTENKENVLLNNKLKSAAAESIDNVKETKLKPDLLSSSFNHIFSPVGEVDSSMSQGAVGRASSEVSRLKATNERSGSPCELDMRAKSQRLMSTAKKPLSQPSLTTSSANSAGPNSILQSVSMPTTYPGSSDARKPDGSGSTSPPSSPRGSLCALQNLGTLRRRGTEDDFTMAA